MDKYLQLPVRFISYVSSSFIRANNKLILVGSLLLVAGTLDAATITTTGSGSWSSTTPNAPWPGGTLPLPGDDVVVGAGFTLTVDAPFTSNSISVAAGAVVINNSNLTITTDLLGTGSLTQGSNAILSIGGLSTITTLTATANPNTVNFTGAGNQTIKATTYHILNTSGGGTKSAGVITVNAELTIGSGTTFSVTAAGAKLFIGLVTISSGDTWTNTTRAATFRGGITNNGTFNGGTTAVYTFNTNSQTLTGNFTLPGVTVTGAAVVLTNFDNNTLTVSNALSGTGRLTQGTNAVLNIGGTSTITNMTATTSGNTVNYTGAAAQTVKNVNYVNLGLSASGAIPIPKNLNVATTSIAGNLSLSGFATTTGVIGLTIGGDVTISGNAALTAGAFTHNIAGNFTNNVGALGFIGTGSTINFNGTTQNIAGGSTTFEKVTLGGSGSKTLSATTVAISDVLTINTGVSANLTDPNTYTANSLITGGLIKVAGTWGNVSSLPAAANIDNTFFSGTGRITVATGAFNYYSRATGNWNTNTTWSTTGFGGAAAASTPGAADFVFIGGGKTVTVAGTESCTALTFDAGTSVINNVTINSGNSLTVSGAVTIPQTVTSGSNTMNVGAGALAAGSIAFTSTPSGAAHQMTISTGTATVTGNVTGIGPSSTISFSGTGLLRLGGAFYSAANGTLSAGAGTVEYNGAAAQSVEAHVYRNLTLSGSLTKTMANSFTMTGNLAINGNATFAVGGFQLVVTGTTNVASGGTLSITNNTNTKTFIGLVTIASGGTWNNPGNEAVTFQGGINNSGSFTAGTGVHTFNTNSQTLTGTLFIIPSMTVTGVVLTNNGTLTVNTALIGTGGITQGPSATLNIGGTSTITSMTATAGTNTVNYTGAAQTVKNVNYVNLGLSGTAAKTLAVGTTSIAGNLRLSGAATTTGVIGLTIGGNVSIIETSSFTAGAFVHNVAGNWTNDNGALGFVGAGSTINFNLAGGQTISGATTTTFNDLILAGSGTKIFGVQTAITGGLSINTGVVADLGIINTHSANTLTLGGVLQSSPGTWGYSGATNNNTVYFVDNSGNGRITIGTGGNNFYSKADGPWNSNLTWSSTGFGGVDNAGPPGLNDFVFIGGGRSVTVSSVEACKALFFDAGTAVTNTLTINSGSLAVTEAITIPRTVTSGSNNLTVSGGSLTAGDIDFTGPANAGGQQMTLTAGTTTVSGNVTGVGTSSTISFGTGLLQVGGSMFAAGSGTFTAGSGTFEYIGSGQTVQALNYNNLTLSGSGTKTLANTVTVGGNLSIGNGVTFTVGAFTLGVTGTTTVGGGTSGTILINSTTGTKTFTGAVTIANGGTWSNTANEAITFQGGLTNNGGTFTDGTGVHTFNTTASQAIGGTVAVSIRSVTVTAPTVLTNNGTLTVNTALIGTGGITQGPSATLNIGGTSTITSMTATAGTNTVNYTGTGAVQIIKNVNYVNLGLSGTSAKTLAVGTTSIAGNLDISDTASATAVIGLTIGGNVVIGAGLASFTAGSFVHNVGGDWTNNGTFTGAGSTINFNRAGTQTITGGSSSFEDVILSGSGAKVFASSITLTGGLSITPPAYADLGSITTHTANTLALNGILQSTNGIWGGTASTSPPASTNDTYFLSTSTGEITIAASGNNYYSIADGAWNSPATWSTVGFGSGINTGTFPGVNDFVFIGRTTAGTRTVTVSGAQSCSDLSFDPGTSVTNIVTIDVLGASLTVSGVVTIPRTFTGGSNTLNVGQGTLAAGDILFTTTGGTAGHQVTISSGAANVTGDVVGIGPSSTVSFSGAGMLRVAGAMFSSANGTLTAFAGSTVEYNGTSTQTVEALSYRNLTLSGSANKSLNANTTILGNLSIGNGVTFTVGAFTLAIAGTTTVGGGTSGTLLINSATGTKTFTGLVTIANGGTWSNTANEAITFQGGITNNGGTFTDGTGLHTFNTTASQTIGGTLSIRNITVTAPTVLTNNGVLTVNTALAGNGIIQGAGVGVTLNIGGTSTITNMTATAGTNTVNYTAAAPQTINIGNYVNLGLSGSGAKTLAVGTTAITGNFTLSGTVSITGAVGLTIGGNMTIGAGTTFTAGAFTHNVAGNWVNNGTFTHSGGSISFNGGAVARSISGSSNAIFNDMVVSNTGGFTISSPQRLNGRLTFGAGSTFNANGNLTLLSTAENHAASIGDLTGITFNGNVSVQRFFGAADNTDRFISSPVSGATVGQLQASTPIASFPVTGGFTGTSYPCTGCDNDGHNVRYYREADTGLITAGYQSWITSTSSTFVPGAGYDAYMWNGVSPTTVTFTGAVNSGTINLGVVTNPPNSTSITFTNNSQPTADGWNLVGNPYPSAILWDQSVTAGWTKTNINDYVYVYDVVGASWRYKDFASTTGTLSGPLNGEIASGQGFWVYTSSPTASLQINEAAKSASTTASYYRTSSNPADRLKISLRSSDGPSTDDIFLFAGSTNKNARDGFKPELGFEPIAMSFIVKDVKYGFYVQKKNDQNIPLYVKIKNEGNYEFSFTTEGNSSELEDYFLVDTYLNKYEKVISGAIYNFDITVAHAKLASDRFYLSTSPDQLLEGREKEVQVFCFPVPTSGDLQIEINSEDVENVEIINSNGIIVQKSIDLKKSNGITRGKVDLGSVTPGLYMLKGYSKGKVFSEKVIKY